MPLKNFQLVTTATSFSIVSESTATILSLSLEVEDQESDASTNGVDTGFFCIDPDTGFLTFKDGAAPELGNGTQINLDI